MPGTRTLRRAGFTLIELLVVIAIIAILAALIGAAVQKTREAARVVQMRSDVTQLDTAIQQFKQRFGVYPPCSGSTPATGNMFMLTTTYLKTDPEYLQLQSIFERMTVTEGTVPGDNGLRSLTETATGSGIFNPTPPNTINFLSHPIPRNTVYLDPNQCLVFFLSGGVFTGYTGYSTNPKTPFGAPDTASGAVGGRLYNGPFFDGFKGSRMQSRKGFVSTKDYTFPVDGTRFPSDIAPVPATDQPWYLDPWGTPYVYFASRQGNDYPFTNTTVAPTSGSQNGLKVGPWGGAYSPNNIPEGMQPFYTGNLTPSTGTTITNQKLMNIKGFQIISAGRDRNFGPGGGTTNYTPSNQYLPGAGAYALNRRGGDDYSNFQQTPLGVTD